MREYKITDNCVIYNDMPRGWAKGKTQPIWHRKVYTMWYNMWARCYKFEEHNSKYYFDCEVDNTFKYLSIFLKWIEQQPYFEDFCLTCSNTMWSVDKDFIERGNKIYTPSLIRLCTQRDNSLERISRKGSPMLNKSVSDKSKNL